MNKDLSKYNFRKIISVSPGKKERVYDLEVEHPDHAFIAKSENRSQRNLS